MASGSDISNKMIRTHIGIIDNGFRIMVAS